MGCIARHEGRCAAEPGDLLTRSDPGAHRYIPVIAYVVDMESGRGGMQRKAKYRRFLFPGQTVPLCVVTFACVWVLMHVVIPTNQRVESHDVHE